MNFAPSQTVDGLLKSADAKRASGDFRAAATLYRSAHETDRERIEPLIGLGETLSYLGAPQDAAEAFRLALQIDGKNTTALRGLGNSMIALGQPSGALPFLERAWELSSDDWRIYLSLGVAYDLTGNPARAQAVYKVGLNKLPDNLDLLSNYALSLALEENFAAAKEKLDGVLERTDAMPRHRQTLALVYGLAGEDERAQQIAELDLSLADAKRNVDFYRTLRQLSDPTQRLRAIQARSVN